MVLDKLKTQIPNVLIMFRFKLAHRALPLGRDLQTTLLGKDRQTRLKSALSSSPIQVLQTVLIYRYSLDSEFAGLSGHAICGMVHIVRAFLPHSANITEALPHICLIFDIGAPE